MKTRKLHFQPLFVENKSEGCCETKTLKKEAEVKTSCCTSGKSPELNKPAKKSCCG